MGGVTVRSIVTSRFALDGGAMHGIVPRTLWERVHPPDARHRIALTARSLLVDNERAGTRTLIETGLGAAWSAKERERYGLDSDECLRESLEATDVEPDSITHVLLTHLHWDHAGGIVAADGTCALPHAEIVVSRRALEHAQGAGLRDAGSFRSDIVKVLSSCTKLRVLDAASLNLPSALGIELRCSDGHTPGLLIPLLRERSDGPPLAVPTDLIPTRSHLKPAWVTAYDLEPAKAAEEKVRLLEEMSTMGGGVLFYHDAQVEAAWADRSSGGFVEGNLAGPETHAASSFPS